jgi:hypothetical protein
MIYESWHGMEIAMINEKCAQVKESITYPAS